jgi:hypothetical protein
MAKRNKRGLMGNSHIPYAQRLKLQQEHDIVTSRDHVARIAMYCTCLALHDIAEAGYTRLVRFAVRHSELVKEFYEDQEVGMAHCVQRMQELGMAIEGEFYQAPQDGSSKKDMELKTHALQAVQVALILGAIAANDVFGFGSERLKRLAQRTGEYSTRYKHQGKKFLLDGMEKLGFPIVDGKAMVYLTEEGQPVTPAAVRRANHAPTDQ